MIFVSFFFLRLLTFNIYRIGMKFPNNTLKISDFEDKTLLIVDDDDPFRGRLGRAMTSKGFEVTLAKGVEEAKLIVKKKNSSFCCYRP